MKRWRMRWRGIALCCALVANLFWGCEASDRGVGLTGDRDYTLTLEAIDGWVHVGDETPILLRLKRTDNTNLSKGMDGVIVITFSEHGRVNLTTVGISVDDDTTKEIVATVVYSAMREGVAKVRGTFRDATAQVKILIASVNP